MRNFPTILFILVLVMSACSSKQKKGSKKLIKKTSNIEINGNDSMIINSRMALLEKIDTSISLTGCSVNISFYGSKGVLLISKSWQSCMSDTRLKWGNECYYDLKGVKLLNIFYDGNKKIIQLERFAGNNASYY